VTGASVGRVERVRHYASRIYRRVERFSIQTWILIFFTTAYVEVFSWFSYLRYLGFLTNAWDLGIFQQALWDSGHGGGLLYYTVELPWNTTGSFLGVHFSPILLLLIPIYTALPGPLTLMVIQSMAVGASAFPMYRLAARRIGPWPGMALAMIFVMSPEMLGGVLFDYHVESFIPLFALTLWVAWEERRYRLAIVAGAFLLGTIEYAPIILGGIAFGFLIRGVLEVRRTPAGPSRWARWRPVVPAAVLTVLSVPLTLLEFYIPKLFSPHTPPVAEVGPLGGSAGDIIKNTFLHPNLILPALRIDWAHKLTYLSDLWWSALFAWPLAPLDALPGLAWMFVALVSIDPNYSVAVGNQYGYLVVPFLFVATASTLGWLRTQWVRRSGSIPGLATLRRRWHEASERRAAASPRRRRRLPRLTGAHVAMLVLVLVAIPSQVAYSPLSPEAHYSWIWAGHFPTTQDAYRDRVLDLIPDNASVSAEPDLFPQLADRPNVYPYYVQGTEFVVCDVTSWWFTTPLPPPMPPDEWVNALRQNVTVPYGMYASADGVLLLKLGYSGPPVYYVPYSASYGAIAFHVANATIGADPTAPFGYYVLPNLTQTTGALWTGPPVLIPPGDYIVTLWFQQNPHGIGSIRVATSVENQTGVLEPLGNITVTSASLAPGWNAIHENITVPYPTYLDVSGWGTGQAPAIEYAGLTLSQIETTLQLGP
jgi:uncharacterized membrane protein